MNSQNRYNKFSAEISYGFNIPSTPLKDISVSNYILPNHIDLGLRYMFSEFIGLKVNYANDRFRDKNNKNIGNGFHRLAIESIWSLTDFFSNNFNILCHTGLGVTYAFPEAIKRFNSGGDFTFGLTPYNTIRYERIRNLMMGVTSQYRYSDNMCFTFDITNVISLDQQYSYSGELLDINYKKVRGSFLNFTIGVQFYFGTKEKHIDWYNRE